MALENLCTPLYIGTFPGRLKISVVIPLYKRGDKISMKNYRPISRLTVFFPKVLEKAMNSRTSRHLPTDNVLVTEQCGFGKEYELKMLPSG